MFGCKVILNSFTLSTQNNKDLNKNELCDK